MRPAFRRRFWRPLLGLTLLVPLLRPRPAAAQPALGPVDGINLPATEIDRIQVGTLAPDFTLATKSGSTVTLSSFRGKQSVVLVFYRGSWCPYCMKQLGELRTLLDAPLKAKVALLVVSPDGPDGIETAITRISRDGVTPDFTFLSDVDHHVIDRYGILNPSGSRRGIPHPATLVIDTKGIVRWKDLQTDYTIRPPNAAILTAINALPK